MTIVLITAVALLIAEAIAWMVGGRLSHRRAGLYDFLANGDAPFEPDGNSTSPSRSNLVAGTNRYADIWIIAPLVILVVAVVAYPIVPGAAIFVRNINIFLLVSFWASILLGICALILLGVGFLALRSSKHTMQLRLALFLALMAVVFGGLTWLVYNPTHAPLDYEETFYTLATFPLNDTNWVQLSNTLLDKSQPQIEFLFMQAIGLPFMLMALLDVLYILACSVYAHLTKRLVSVSVNLLILAPILAGAASLCFGII